MIKLKEIIMHLDEGVFESLERSFVKNKADNFLYLLKSYRNNKKDAEIIDTLNVNSNSFYVLKSRLFDKIQEHLSGDIYVSKEELLKKLNTIPEICVKEPREVATAFLKKLEKDLLQYDMHNELLIVYSALKKLHLYSEKYFHYSQLFNKHIAFSLSLEKAEETLGNFNRVLGQYGFSRSARYLETLKFLRKEVNDHYALNPSRQIEIIKSLIELQLCIFCNTDLNKEINVEEQLNQTEKIILELPESSAHKTWLLVVHFLCFEYYYKINQIKKALLHYEKVAAMQKQLLLYSNIGLTSKFFITKIAFMQQQGKVNELAMEDPKQVIFDKDDTHSKVLFTIYDSMVSYYCGNIREAANKLNTILNENSFKDLFHINADVKLTLAFYYIEMKEFEIADSIIKGIYRKIKSEKIDNYSNILDIIKVFEIEIKQSGGNITDKQKDHFTLFTARNKKENEVLRHLIMEFENKYN